MPEPLLLCPETREQQMALTFVLLERCKQDQKWGVERSLEEGLWYRILGEEFGEVGRATLEKAGKYDPDTFEDWEPARAALAEELAQVAAVAVSWLEQLIREHFASRKVEVVDGLGA